MVKNLGFAIVGFLVNVSAYTATVEDEYIAEQIWVGLDLPTILVAHGCSGNLPNYGEWAKQISTWGFNVIVVDSFTKRRLTRGTCGRGLLFPAQRREEMYRIAAKVKNISNQKVGLIGFSHGGNLVLHVGVDEKNNVIDSAVAYYPNCSEWGRKFTSNFDIPIPNYHNPKIPVAVMYGEKDSWTPPQECSAVVKGENYETHLFSNSTHAFDMNLPDRVVAGFRLSYNKEADEKSRVVTKEFFEKTLRK